MLRITIEERNSSTKFRLEGKLKGEWVAELERCWIYVRNASPTSRVAVDLNNVDFVDDRGKTLLARMVSQGAELKARDPMMNSVVKQIVRRFRAPESCEMPRSGATHTGG